MRLFVLASGFDLQFRGFLSADRGQMFTGDGAGGFRYYDLPPDREGEWQVDDYALELVDEQSGDVRASVLSDADGRYEFNLVPVLEGRQVLVRLGPCEDCLHLRSRSAINGIQPVATSPRIGTILPEFLAKTLIPCARSITPVGGPNSSTRNVMLVVPSTNPPPDIAINVRGDRYTFHAANGGRLFQLRNLEFCYYGYDRDPAAIGLENSSSNRFERMFDGAHLFSQDPTAPTENLDFHDNLVLNCGDDGLETDGIVSNCRIYSNVFSNFLTGISVAPATLCPTYIFRNTLLNWRTVISPPTPPDASNGIGSIFLPSPASPKPPARNGMASPPSRALPAPATFGYAPTVP